MPEWDMPDPADRPEGLDAASVRGRRQAEKLDAALRELEARERAELTAWRGTGDSATVSSAELARLHQQVAHLAGFRRAVIASMGWRLLQALRRPFGRAW
jgi:hypothetical protein